MYKQLKPLGSSGKIQVTPEQSEVVQKALFEMCFSFASGATYVQSTDLPYLYWAADKKTITRSLSSKTFNKSSNPLHLFTDYFEPI